jgi:conjugal transfer pilus assembly protein TraF
MIKLILSLLMVCSTGFADSPKGYLWYNLPKKISQKPIKKGISFKKLSYTDKDAVLRFYTMEALHKVRFTHKLEDERAFLALQDYWLKEAVFHGKLNQKALLAYPQYDFSVSHPSSSIGTQLYEDLKLKKENNILKKISSKNGLIFFYRSQNPIDIQQISILDSYAKQYGFSWIGVSVDGKKAPQLPNSRIDHGEAQKLNVRYFPAILMVNPKEKKVSPIAYGLVTQDVLTRNVIAVYSKFKEGLDA